MKESEQRRKRQFEQEDGVKRQTRTKQNIDALFCKKCLIKLRITNTFSCKCRGSFCSKHRYTDEHGCIYDYKSENRKRLEKENPKILSSRITQA